MKKIIILAATLFFALFFSSCKDKATIEVINNIKNVTLENISYGDRFSIRSNLLPGASTKMEIDTEMGGVNFPMEEEIKFYMSAKGNKVLLHTRQKYRIDKDDHLRVVLTNETEVYNPINNISAEIKNVSLSQIASME